MKETQKQELAEARDPPRVKKRILDERLMRKLEDEEHKDEHKNDRR